MNKNWNGVLPIYINNFNQLSSVKKMAEFFDDIPDTKVIVVDNASSYPPLLNWYNECKYTIRRVGNGGPRAPWLCSAVHDNYGNNFYVVTDADLDVSDCPKDLLNVLIDGLQNHKVIKSGLSIEINDLPDGNPAKKGAIAWERKFWDRKTGYKTKNGTQFYHADVDTTFAVYKMGKSNRYKKTNPAIRSDRPYTCKHIPWYITEKTLSREYQFIIKSYPVRSVRNSQDWIQYLRPLMKQPKKICLL